MSDVTLTEFLLARIAEDEAAERVALTGDRVVGPVDPAISDEWHWVKRGRREREAKRRIVEECDGFDEQGLTVRQHLAAIYADHPDYREEWKP